MRAGTRGPAGSGRLREVGYVDIAGLSHQLSDGRILFQDVNFRVGEGSKTALIGANGAGKTTLMRIVAGDLPAQNGSVARTGGLGVMRQFIGSVRDDTSVEQFLVALAPEALRTAAHDLAASGHDGTRRHRHPDALRPGVGQLG